MKWFFLLCVYIERFLWNYLKFWGYFLWIVDVLFICRMLFFGYVSFLVLVKKINFNKFDFVEDVNLWGCYEF